ncbi:hypothetical protein FRC06_002252, partial [Ceratobasidium sp. 370]
MSFSDGTKYEDLLRVVLHGAMSLPPHVSTLIELIRMQAEIRMLASFEVHTEETVSQGHELVRKFHQLSRECTKKYGKSFNFPKMHMLCHLFDDIWRKGAPANYSTKPCEQMHGKLRRAYGVSSKKSSTVDSEILHKMHASTAYELIAAEIEDFMVFQAQDAEDGQDKSESEVFHISLGSQEHLLSTELLEEKHVDNPVCWRLGSRICDFVDELDPTFVEMGETIK